MYTPVNPIFTIQKWGFRGSKLYRRVFVMVIAAFPRRLHLYCLVCRKTNGKSEKLYSLYQNGIQSTKCVSLRLFEYMLIGLPGTCLNRK